MATDIDRCAGRFRLPHPEAQYFWENNTEDIPPLWGLIFPLRVEHLAYEDVLECVGVSPLFRMLNVGEVVPNYEITYDKETGWSAKEIEK